MTDDIHVIMAVEISSPSKERVSGERCELLENQAKRHFYWFNILVIDCQFGSCQTISCILGGGIGGVWMLTNVVGRLNDSLASRNI